MRVHEPMVLILPFETKTKIDYYISNLSKPPFEKELLYYIIKCLIEIEGLNRNRNMEFYPIKNNHLLKLFQSKYTLNKYLKLLTDIDVIESDNNSKKGKKCYHYRVVEPSNHETVEYTLNQAGKLFKFLTIEFRLANNNDNRLPAHINLMKKYFHSLNFDYEGALRLINSNFKGNNKVYALSSINNLKSSKTRYFKRNKTNNRIDSNLTNLKSELRTFIDGNYVSMDLNNSQPYFLSQFINLLLTLRNTHNLSHYTLCSSGSKIKLFKEFDNKTIKEVLLIPQLDEKSKSEELIRFTDVCSNGHFYEFFLSLDSCKELSRKEIKEMMFKVLYSKNNHYSKEKKLFRNEFPTVFKIIEILKKKNHKSLAIAMQQLESFVFIDNIAKKLVEEGITPLTIHDSIIVKEEEVVEAKRIVFRVFSDFFSSQPQFEFKAL